MKKISLFSALFLSSSLLYAGWNKYDNERDPNNFPQGACLEMMCEHGCVENDEGIGHCCSSGQLGEDCYGGLCCEGGLVCSGTEDKGICRTCLADSECVASCGEDCTGGCECGEDGKCRCVASCVTDSDCVETCGEDCIGGCVCGEDSKCRCGDSCVTNSDCLSGFYCNYTDSLSEGCTKPEMGICTKVDSVNVGDGTYAASRDTMDYWSALNFCDALGKESVSYLSHCSPEEQTKNIFSQKICSDWNMDDFDKNLYWTTTTSGSCSSYYTAFNKDEASGNSRWNEPSLRALCQMCPSDLPGRDEVCTQGCGCQAPYACEKGINRCSCAETSGIIFFIDRSTGNLSNNVKKTIQSLDKDWEEINTAVYFQDYSSASIKDERLVNPLKYGRHTADQLEEWFNYGNIGGAASFQHALDDIKKYCKDNSQILLLFFANNQNQHYKGNLNKELAFWRDFARYAEKNCQFNVWLVGANEKIADLFSSTKFNLTKSVSAYEYVFRDAVEAVCQPRKLYRDKKEDINLDICSIPTNFPKTTKSQCDLCTGGTRFWPEPANYVESKDKDKVGVCYMCTHQGNIATSQEQCNRCPQRKYNPTTRVCSVEGCYGSNGTKMTSQECYSCRKTLSEDGTEVETTEAEDPTVRFLGTNGYCYPCNFATNIVATAEECAKCNGMRSMSGNYCVKEVCDKTKNYTGMSQEDCWQVCSADGQEAPFSHFWLNDGKKEKNACYSCSYNSAVKTTYEESARCIGKRFYSKSSGTSYSCSAADVVLSDISEGSEEYELCLACGNRSIDTETKKCVRMDCESKVSYANVTEDVCHACGESDGENAYRFFVRTNKNTGRGNCFSCSDTRSLAANVSIMSADQFVSEVEKYCKGKRFIAKDRKTSYSCDTSIQVQIFSVGAEDKELEGLCLACGNRSVDETTGKCVKMSCDANSKDVYTNVSQESCHECPNRFWTQTNAVKKLGTCYPCTSEYKSSPNTTLEECQICGSERYFTKPNTNGIGQCRSCSETTAGSVGDNETLQEMCLECKGGNYRTISATNTCQLFDCDTSSYYKNMTENQCHTVCGQTQDKPEYFWESSGGAKVTSNCWPCQYKKEQAVRVSSASECYRCNEGTQNTNTNHFYSTNGFCYQCFSNQTPKVSGEENCHEQCSNRFMDSQGRCVAFACKDISLTPKVEPDLCHECQGDEARFMNTSKQCVSCNTESQVVPATASEAARCEGKRFLSGNNTYSCSYNNRVKITTAAEEELCTKCPQRVVYQDSTGAKYCSKLDCSVSAVYANTKKEDCHSCEGGAAFWLQNKCYSCLYTSNVSNVTEEECKRCDNRYFNNKACKICPNTTTEKATEDGLSCVPYEDQFFDVNTGKVYQCSDKTNIKTLASECQRCPNRHMDGDYCKLCPNGTLSKDGISCGEDRDGEFMGTDNKFHKCDKAAAVASSKSECDRCSERYWYNNSCKLCSNKSRGIATESGDSCKVESGKLFNASTNAVVDCSQTSDVTTVASACLNCNNRYMSGTKCRLCPNGTLSKDGISCGEDRDGEFMGNDNKFHKCDKAAAVASSKSECDRCSERYWYNNSCKLCSNKSTGIATESGDSCKVESGKLFNASTNAVVDCSQTSDVTTVASACLNCNNRYMSGTKCRLCPNGTLSKDGISCGEDRDGEFMGNDNKFHKCDKAAAVASSKSECDRCSERYYQGSTCYLTPKGYYSKNGVKTECGTGYSCPVAGMTKPIACEAGTYSDKATSTSCTVCPAGYYCPGAKEKMACDKGYSCPNTGMSAPLKCEAGTYSDKTTSKSCTVCPVGTYCPNDAMGAPLDCGVGYYCPEKGLTERKQCAKGTYSNKSKSSTCSNCLKGYYCPGGTDKISCGTGHYCPNTNMTSPFECSVGTYSSGFNTTSTCTACSVGYYCPAKAQSEQTPCGLGNYCPKKNMTAPLKCEPGTYSDTQNATTCKACAKGTYQEQAGKSSCNTCSGNTITSSTKQKSCTVCTGSKPCSNATHTTCVSKTTKGAICS